MNSHRGRWMVDGGRTSWWCLLGLVGCLITPGVSAETDGEARFFRDCPRRDPARLHDERNPADLHSLWYSAFSAAQLEILQVADWMIDAPLPGPPCRPLRWTVQAIRSGYHRLPPVWVVRRSGELVDALQIPQLSLGDVSSISSSGPSMLGGGTLVRVERLIDWGQHMTGDLNRGLGRPVGRSEGLIKWSGPEQAVDAFQWVLAKTVNRLGVMVARIVDGTLTAAESAGDAAWNIGRAKRHDRRTVFLRLPVGVYRAHQVWVLTHRARLVVGRAEDFTRSTHAALAHRRARDEPARWRLLDWPYGESEPVIVMLPEPLMARAPSTLAPYVVPGAWVLNALEKPAPTR